MKFKKIFGFMAIFVLAFGALFVSSQSVDAVKKSAKADKVEYAEHYVPIDMFYGYGTKGELGYTEYGYTIWSDEKVKVPLDGSTFEVNVPKIDAYSTKVKKVKMHFDAKKAGYIVQDSQSVEYTWDEKAGNAIPFVVTVDGKRMGFTWGPRYYNESIDGSKIKFPVPVVKGFDSNKHIMSLVDLTENDGSDKDKYFGIAKDIKYTKLKWDEVKDDNTNDGKDDEKVLFKGYISYIPSYGIVGWTSPDADRKVNKIDGENSYYKHAKYVSVVDKKTVDDNMWYKLSDGSWIPAKYFSMKIVSPDEAVAKRSGVVKIKYKKGYGINLWNNFNNPKFLGRRLMHGSRWKIFELAYDKDGRPWYNVGRGQWIQAKYATLEK